MLSSNLNGLELLKKNPDKINWFYLSVNPNAIQLLQENKNAIKLLKENPDKINWFQLSANENANLVKWTSVKTGDIYYRYYNIYPEGELKNEITKLKPEFNIIDSGYEKGNYYIKIMK